MKLPKQILGLCAWIAASGVVPSMAQASNEFVKALDCVPSNLESARILKHLELYRDGENGILTFDPGSALPRAAKKLANEVRIIEENGLITTQAEGAASLILKPSRGGGYEGSFSKMSDSGMPIEVYCTR